MKDLQIKKTLCTLPVNSKSLSMNNTGFKRSLIGFLNDALHKRFTRNGNVFSARQGDMTYYICLQTTLDSSDERMQVTVNIETSSHKLYKAESIDIPEKLYRSSVKNIGEFSGTRSKKWWIISDEATLRSASEEIIHILNNKVLPEFRPNKIFHWFHRFEWSAAS